MAASRMLPKDEGEPLRDSAVFPPSLQPRISLNGAYVGDQTAVAKYGGKDLVQTRHSKAGIRAKAQENGSNSVVDGEGAYLSSCAQYHSDDLAYEHAEAAADQDVVSEGQSSLHITALEHQSAETIRESQVYLSNQSPRPAPQPAVQDPNTTSMLQNSERGWERWVCTIKAGLRCTAHCLLVTFSDPILIGGD